MSIRTRSRSVTFAHPFFLTGFDAVQAAGTYAIDIDEEAIEQLSFPAFRRVATRMQIPSHGAIEYRTIGAAELDEALERDAMGPVSGAHSASLAPADPKGEAVQRAKTRPVKRR